MQVELNFMKTRKKKQPSTSSQPSPFHCFENTEYDKREINGTVDALIETITLTETVHDKDANREANTSSEYKM